MGTLEKNMTAKQIERKRINNKIWYDSKKDDPYFKKRRNARTEKWRINNREEYLNSRREQNKKNRLKRIEHRLKTRFNLTIEQYNELFIKQNGCCAICGTHQNELKMKLCVDHNHDTGEIRGLLCKPCNLILGNAYDNINLLESAIKYLKNDK